MPEIVQEPDIPKMDFSEMAEMAGAGDWYKESVPVEPDDRDEDDEKENPYMKSSRVQMEKFAKDWPEGRVFRVSYGEKGAVLDALCVSYAYELKDQGMIGTANIVLNINGSDPKAAYELVKARTVADRKSMVPDAEWIEWPRGYPNKNEYEQVSQCGALHDFSTVAWVQNKTLVILLKMPMTEKDLVLFPKSERSKIITPDLQDFADGVWQAVNGMGL